MPGEHAKMNEAANGTEQPMASRYNSILLALVLVFLFGVPFLPHNAHKAAYNIITTGILIFAALSVDRGRKRMFVTSCSAR